MKSNVININTKIKKALELLQKSKIKTLAVINKDKKLLGTITDGDIRRGLLKNINISDNIQKVYNKNPNFYVEGRKNNKNFLRKFLPVVDKNKKFLKISHYLETKKSLLNPVFILAGGKGKRLRPITRKIPKPLVKVDHKNSILGLLLQNLKKEGFINFYISVNYLAGNFKKYFKKNYKDLNIKIIKEKKILGTAGPLSLLNLKNINYPILVLNGDLITNMNFIQLLNYHKSMKSDMTVCVKKESQIFRFSKLDVDKNQNIKDIKEKPNIEHLLSAGIYLINRKLIKIIKKNRYLDMPDFISELIQKKYKVKAFYIFENWLDVGTKKTLSLARKNLKKN